MLNFVVMPVIDQRLAERMAVLVNQAATPVDKHILLSEATGLSGLEIQ